MRKLVALGSIVTLAGTLAWADTTPPAPPANPVANKGAEQPCKQIERACTAAGFVRGEAQEGKGLFMNCMNPILKGQSVAGVTVDPGVVAACKQRMANRRRHHSHGGPGAQGGQGGQGGGNPSGGNPPSGESGESSGQ